MTLTIHKLHTRCRSPKSAKSISSIVDEVAQSHLTAELGAHLGPSLDRLPAVVCIRDLQVRLKIPARQLNASTLAEAWARAFTVALHHALAYPDGDGIHALRRFQSDAAYKAAMIWHLATKGAVPSWEFPELDVWSGFSSAEATQALLIDNPALTIEVIEELACSDRLEFILELWDELGMERLFQTIAAVESAPADLRLADLIELGHAAATALAGRERWPAAGRHQTIRVWLSLSRRFSIRAVWHGMRLLVRFLEEPHLLRPRDKASGSIQSPLLSAPIPFPSWCAAIITEISARQDPLSPLQAQSASQISMLHSVLHSLRPLIPSAANPLETGKWFASDCAGILLLLQVVRRQDLWRLIREPEFIRFGGPRALSFLLTAIGMKLVGKWSPGESVETAVALFAGIFADQDRIGMRQFFAEADVSAVASVASAKTWDEAIEAMAAQFTRAFAQRIRGFRQASHDAMIRQFIRIPGRILVEERRLLVILETSPCAVALHISGADESIEYVEWLADRRVDFVLEGL